MIVYTATVGTYEDVRPLGHWTTPETRDAALLELVKSKGVDGPVDCGVLEVTGDPTVLVLVDDDERLVAGPFASPAEAWELFPDEEAHTAEWSVRRYAEAVAERRVRAELRRLLGEVDAGALLSDLRAELEASLDGGA